MKRNMILLVLLTMPSVLLAHKQHVHQYFCMQGYNLLRMHLGFDVPSMQNRIGGMEAFYAGDYAWQRGYVTTGAWREDEEDVVFGYRNFLTYPLTDRALISITHFWDADDGDLNDNTFQVAWSVFAGTIGPYPNAYRKMLNYAYGGWCDVWFLWNSLSDV